MATTTATGRIPTTDETAPESIEAIAAEWVEAKNDEKAASKVKKAASDRRTEAGRELADRMTNGANVTVNGNRTYTLEVQDNETVVASRVLASLRTLRPEIASLIAQLEAAPENRTAYSKVALKPFKA